MKPIATIFGAIAAGLFAAHAWATPTLVTWTGTVSLGTDNQNYFGLGEDLAGAPMVLRYTFDWSDRGDFSTDGVTFARVQGTGPNYAFGAPDNSPGSAVITINGVSKALGGGYQSYLERVRGPAQTYFQAVVEDVGGEGTYSYQSLAILPVVTPGHGLSLALDAPFSFTPTQSVGSVSFSDYDTATDLGISFGLSFGAEGVLTVGPTPPSVPEPATWLMMIAGFGLAGAALRRRPVSA